MTGSGLRNYARTAMLMAGLIVVLAIGGRLLGGLRGMVLFGAIGLAVNAAAYWFSDKIALMAHRAQPATHWEAPTLHAIVKRLCDRAHLPMPRLYLIPSASMNAFATGRNPQHAAVAVTEGLLDMLDEREVEAVIAHELSHVRNRDVLIATVAAAIAGLVASIGHIAQFGLMFGGSRSDDRDAGLGAIAWVFIAPLIALFIQLAISRSRELAADASGAALVGDPNALADALLKLDHASHARPYEFAGPATAHLFIVSPLHGRAASLMNLLSTHPPIDVRVRRLRAMAAPSSIVEDRF